MASLKIELQSTHAEKKTGADLPLETPKMAGPSTTKSNSFKYKENGGRAISFPALMEAH
jgi:hypothetical protein